MNMPEISVLMPVYNGQKYLAMAIESILNQTFADFEFIIIDDHSTDNSLSIIQSYSDPRIKLFRNEENFGVAKTLNKGIDLARGKYLARMDCDDISLLERLTKQHCFLNDHPSYCAVAAKVSLIDPDGKGLGRWSTDWETIDFAQICSRLPMENCLAHPSIMIRTDVVKNYRYNQRSSNFEDYDLWLRLISDGHKIGKIDEVLLNYRVHPDSVTTISNERGFATKNIKCKGKYLLSRLSNARLTLFDLKVAQCLIQDIFSWIRDSIKVKAKDFLKKCLFFAGKCCGVLLPRINQSSLFFFFPFWHVGGAEQVHANIIASLAEKVPWVFVTNKSVSDSFKSLFEKSSKVFDISWINKPRLLWPFCLGAISKMINRYSKPTVFGSNSIFFYHLVPHLQPHVVIIDLLHAFGAGLEDASLPVVTRLNRRIVVNQKTKQDLASQYSFRGLDPKLLDRVSVIENSTEIPPHYPLKEMRRTLRILYMGRGAKVKRVHIIFQVAAKCHELKVPAKFIFVGSNLEDQAICRENCILVGEIIDPAEKMKYYEDADLLMLSSSREGFPLVVMEAMAHGVLPVCTKVGGIPEHVIPGVTGILIEAQEEEKIVNALLNSVLELEQNRKLLRKMSKAAYERAVKHFDRRNFRAAYRTLFLMDNCRQDIMRLE